MTTNDYKTVLSGAIERLRHLSNQQVEIDVEISKLWQFIWATVNMLPDEEQTQFITAADEAAKQYEAKSHSLTEAVRKVLENSPTEWFTTTQVRQRLTISGFDFSQYTSNALASVGTVLRRLVPREAKTTTIDGVTAYQWIKRFPRRNVSKARAFAGYGASRSIANTPDEVLKAQSSPHEKS
jgi:hypothetical protein